MTTLRRLMLPLALCSVLALGACGSSPSDGSSGSKAFPQLVNGRFTEDMCDVLTHEDFAAVGRDVETGLRDTDPLMAPNTVTCSLQPGVDRYLLNLQPDTESAQLFFQYERQAHDDFMHRAGMTTKALQQNVVAQADESWFDIDPLNSSGSTPGTVLTARKGSLLVTFNQGASGEGAQEDVAKLVGTILERLPEVASVQTGHAHTLTFKVTGKGTKTADILHADPMGGESTNLRDADLPYTAEVRFPSMGFSGASYRMSASSFDSPDSELTCVVEIDGKPVENAVPDAPDLPDLGANTCIVSGSFEEEK